MAGTASPEGLKVEQRHGKGRVRVCRVWRGGNEGTHLMVEWNVSISLLSDCIPAYVSADNSSIVATDTIKNTVYAKAKECSEPLSVEEFGILLGRHFVSFYPVVSTAIIRIVEKPWERVSIDGQAHNHGFKLGCEKHTTEVTVKRRGGLLVTSSIEGLALLKTTQSGFVGFVRDKYTMLPETTERMLATEVSASWRYMFGAVTDVFAKPFSFTQRYLDVKKVLSDTFFGPPKGGVYSPSVQNTLYLMAKAVLFRFPEIASIELKMPNLHFLPVNLPSRDNPTIIKFDDDVFLPTDEPHGTIEASLSRTMSKL